MSFREMTAENNENAALSPGGEMTLEDALAVYLYYLGDKDKIGEREERILDAAWKIIERHAKRKIAFPENGSAQ
jgi:hypothetical protein